MSDSEGWLIFGGWLILGIFALMAASYYAGWRDAEKVKRVVEEVLTFPCQCDEVYTDRGLKDPHCRSCEAAEDRDEILRRLGLGV